MKKIVIWDCGHPSIITRFWIEEDIVYTRGHFIEEVFLSATRKGIIGEGESLLLYMYYLFCSEYLDSENKNDKWLCFEVNEGSTLYKLLLKNYRKDWVNK